MFQVNKVVVISVVPHRKESVDLPILKLVEDFVGYKPLSHVDKRELTPLRPNTRRFLVSKAYGNRDK